MMTCHCHSQTFQECSHSSLSMDVHGPTIVTGVVVSDLHHGYTRGREAGYSLRALDMADQLETLRLIDQRGELDHTRRHGTTKGKVTPPASAREKEGSRSRDRPTLKWRAQNHIIFKSVLRQGSLGSVSHAASPHRVFVDGHDDLSVIPHYQNI